MEKRLVRSLIFGVFGGNDGRMMITQDSTKNQGSEEDDVEDYETDSEGDSTEGEGGSEGRRHGNGNSSGGLRLGRINKRRKTANVRRILSRAEHDWHHFCEHGSVSVAVQRKKRVEEESMRECVTFIFARQNRQLLAHGTKIVRTQDGEKIVFPKVRRTRSRKAIARSYVSMKADKPEPKRISFGSMMIMLRALTSGKQHMQQCVDYCLGVLVFENFRTLKGIINNCVDDMDKRKLLTKQVDAVSDYLKHGYLQHVDMDSDPAHASTPSLLPGPVERIQRRNGAPSVPAVNMEGVGDGSGMSLTLDEDRDESESSDDFVTAVM